MCHPAVSLLVTLLSLPPAAQEAPSFNGAWERDPDKSDDAEKAMAAAAEQMRGQGSGRRAPPPGGRPPAESPGRSGRGGTGRTDPVAEELTVETPGSEFHVDDGERLRIYYLDGEKHKRNLPNGVELETVATRSGNTVIIEEKMNRGKLTYTYTLSADGKNMTVVSTIKLGGMKEPVVIRTVYDRVDFEGAP